MRSAVLRWFDQAVAALRELMDRPWTLFFALLAVNAIALPYRGFVHDSQLYAVQVMNRVENGAYADDLFFRYGSQDKYSAPPSPPPRWSASWACKPPSSCSTSSSTPCCCWPPSA